MKQTGLFPVKKEDNQTSETNATATGNTTGKIKLRQLRRVYTIGCSLPARMFFALLKRHRVPVLIDTRQAPRSPYARFADSVDLPYLCEMHGIEYVYVKELAPTAESRERLRNVERDGTAMLIRRQEAWTQFLEGYVSHLMRHRVLRVGSPLRDIIERDVSSIAVMCHCAHPQDCHRRATASVMEHWIEGITVKHLMREELLQPRTPRVVPPRCLIRDIPKAGLKADSTNERSSK